MLVDTAQQALARVPGWEDCTGIALQKIGGGNTNSSWLIERNGQSFVLRIDTPVAAKLALDRANERVVRAHVSTAGLAPGLIHADPQRGILLSEYVEGRTWLPEDVLEPQSLLNLAQTLRRLYALPVIGAKFDLGTALSRYADQLGDETSSQRAHEALRILKTIGSRPEVLCHNDLVAANIIAGEQLWLIDWEYTGVGDPLFDLAVVVEHHDVNRSLAYDFVEASLGCMSRQIAADLSAYGEVYRHLVKLWQGIV